MSRLGKLDRFDESRTALFDKLSMKNGVRKAFFGSDGSVYTGEWKDNLKCGFGTLKKASKAYSEYNNEIYEGHWIDDTKDGQGKLYAVQIKNSKLINKFLLYDGEWKLNKKHGFGKEYFMDGSYYEGNYEYGCRNGFGIFKHIDGSIYEGFWKNNARNGNGKLEKPNGDIYMGEWSRDLRCGVGNYFNAEKKMSYDSTWVNDSPRSGIVTFGKQFDCNE
ncbi:MAG: MORN repeat-containing protein 3 [Paramarteilia canceri]